MGVWVVIIVTIVMDVTIVTGVGWLPELESC